MKTIDTQTGERREFSAKLFFLCASTLGSTQILLNSPSDRFPDGLANRSGTLGRYLMDHGMLVHTGIFVDNPDRYYTGNRPNGLYIPRFRNNGGQDTDADFVRGYGYQAHVLRPDWQLGYNRKGFGAEYKESLRRPAPFWVWALGSFIECLPRAENRAFLHPTLTDRFGIPQLAVEFQWGDNERALARDTGVQAGRILRAAGAVFPMIGEPESISDGGSGIHEMGTARMGADPAQSVLDRNNRTHDLDNLFVTDGSFMTSAACVNPSLTYMAFTARAAAFAAQQFAAGAYG